MALPSWHEMSVRQAQDTAAPPPSDFWGYEDYCHAEPPPSFFKNVPENAKALFSTERGTKPLQPVHSPDWKRTCYPWGAEKLAHMCYAIRQEYPSECKYLRPVQSCKSCFDVQTELEFMVDSC